MMHYLQIGADGANSIVRRQMGVKLWSESYNQMGVIATVNLKQVSTTYLQYTNCKLKIVSTLLTDRQQSNRLAKVSSERSSGNFAISRGS